ncbi:thiolase domain-containing protein [Nanoarchaeota archaeon]
MYIKGVGMTKFGLQGDSTHELVYEAVEEALEDSNTSFDKVDAVVISTTDNEVNGERQRHFSSALASMFKKKMPIIRVPAVCGGGGAALWTGSRLKYDNVLVIGADRVCANVTPIITDQILQAAERRWEQTEAMLFPVQNALVAQQHMIKYGTTVKDLARVAYKNHKNAYHNPKARFYKKKVSMKDIMKSPIVASPFRLYDCSVSVNGAAVALVTKEKSDVKIAASALNTDTLPTFERPDATTWQSTIMASTSAYKQAGITPSDVNVVEVHDAFTILELMAYEDLGFCKKGDAKKLIRSGKTDLNGRLPVNPSGGLKAKGHPISATGMAQVYEIVKQLRGQCDKRQVKDAKIGLTCNFGGAGGTTTVHILKKAE